MSTLLITHPAAYDHLNPMGHPERPERLRAIEQALEEERFQPLAREQAPLAPEDVVALDLSKHFLPFGQWNIGDAESIDATDEHSGFAEFLSRFLELPARGQRNRGPAGSVDFDRLIIPRQAHR